MEFVGSNLCNVNLRRSLALVACWLTIANPVLANPAPLTLNQQVEEVVSYLEGTMDTTQQVAANSKAPSVRMTTCRISVSDAPSETSGASVFLYQEQALTRDLTKPYRQRFLQIAPSPLSQSVRSLSFRPSNPEAWSGFCNKPLATRVIQPKDLGTPVCSVFLKRAGEGYVGNTPVDGCPANVRGAVRITNHIILHPNGMDTWDRGFDADGKQVWGAKTESYQFRRIKSETGRKE